MFEVFDRTVVVLCHDVSSDVSNLQYCRQVGSYCCYVKRPDEAWKEKSMLGTKRGAVFEGAKVMQLGTFVLARLHV